MGGGSLNYANTLYQRLDRITEVLLELGYFRRDESGELSLTPNGRTLRRIYGERDLLIAEQIELSDVEVWSNAHT